jgi:hypothetical protein
LRRPVCSAIAAVTAPTETADNSKSVTAKDQQVVAAPQAAPTAADQAANVTDCSAGIAAVEALASPTAVVQTVAAVVPVIDTDYSAGDLAEVTATAAAPAALTQAAAAADRTATTLRPRLVVVVAINVPGTPTVSVVAKTAPAVDRSQRPSKRRQSLPKKNNRSSVFVDCSDGCARSLRLAQPFLYNDTKKAG